MTDITVAVDQAALSEAFGALIEIFQFDFSKTTEGDVRFGIDLQCHLERGNFALHGPDPNSPIYIGGYLGLTNIVIAWDKLDFTVGLDIPGKTIPSFCIIPNPFGGCLVSTPSVTTPSFDVSVTLPIDNIVRSQIDLGIAPVANHIQQSATQWEWLVVPHIVWQQIELLDIADTIGDFIDGLVKQLIDQALSFLPGWAQDILNVLVGGLANLVRDLLNLPHDLQDWLSTLLRVSLDPFDFIFQLLENHFQNKLSLYSISDPMQVLAAQTSPIALPAVYLPIPSLNLTVTADEFIIEATA
jgi:hypothetical protein